MAVLIHTHTHTHLDCFVGPSIYSVFFKRISRLSKTIEDINEDTGVLREVGGKKTQVSISYQSVLWSCLLAHS